MFFGYSLKFNNYFKLDFDLQDFFDLDNLSKK